MPSAFTPRLKPAARQAIRARLGIPDGAFVHLYVGSGFERKGVAQLIQAMRGVREQMHLVIVGADRKSGAYQAQAASAGLGEQIHFAGPQKDIENWYAMADSFVLPTLYDPFPNAAMEAMASGLPVITSTQCGAAEIVEPAQCGWICDALDVATLGQYLRDFTPATAANMGARARALAERFTTEKMAEQLTTLYRSLSVTDSPTR
jgi:UDP-glucose:(heptosyl)LPS alpha-1,3-glucosyltransferase